MSNTDNEDDELDPVGAFEAKYASGFTKEAGKHVMADGLTTEGGNRKIVPCRDPDEEYEWQWRAEQISELAQEVPRIL
jgi:hypothetical protein